MMKIISALLTLIMMCSVFSFDSSALAAEQGEFAENLEFLQALSIVNDEDKFIENPINEITRGEFLSLCIRAYGAEKADGFFDGVTYFTDVDEAYAYAFYVNYAVALGIIGGYDNRIFNPDNLILTNEAIKVVVSLLGYGTKAEYAGGYPFGYLKVANDLKLLKGLSFDGGKTLTVEEALKLLGNALEIKMIEMKTAGVTGKPLEEKGQTLLDKMRVIKSKGFVTSVLGTTVSGNAVKVHNEISINTVKYNLKYAPAKDFIGRKVITYIKLSKEGLINDLVYASVDKGDKGIKVYSENIHSITGFNTTDSIINQAEPKIKYWVNSITDKEPEEIRLLSVPLVIYNGEARRNINNQLFMPSAGNVILNDIDDDGIYDLVIINSFKTKIAEKASEVAVQFQNGEGQLTLDKSDKTKIIRIIKEGNEIETKDIKKNDVLSIAMSDSQNVINIFVSTQIIQGVVEEVDSEFVYIDEERYKIDESCKVTIMLGRYTKLYLNNDEQIAKAEIMDDSNEKVGYLMEIEKNRGLSDALTLKLAIYGKTIDLSQLMTKQKITYTIGDLTRKVNASELLSLFKSNELTKRQLIKFTTNDNNEIIKITAAKEGKDSNFFSLDYQKDAAIYSEPDPIFDSKFRVNPKTTKIIVIPPAKYESSPEKYKSSIAFTKDSNYQIEVYNSNDFNVSEFVVITQKTATEVTNPPSTTTRSYPIAVVEGISKKINEDEEIVNAVKLRAGNNINSLEIVDEVYNAQNLKFGDIIQYDTNSDGKISWVQKWYSFSTDTLGSKTTPGYGEENIGGTLESPDALFTYGEVINVSSTDIMINAGDGSRPFTIGKTLFVINGKNQTVSAEKIDNISIGDSMFIRVYRRVIGEMVIIRN